MRLSLATSLTAASGSNEPTVPYTLSNVRAFFRADRGVTDISGKASSWANQTAYAITALTQGTAAARPTISANGAAPGRPSLIFDNADDVLTGGALSEWMTDTTGTVYILSKQTGVDQNNALAYQNHAQWNRGAYAGVATKVGPLVQAWGFDTALRATATQAISLASWNIYRWRHAGGNLFLRLNSAAEGAGVALAAIGDVASAVTVGNGASASPANSEIAAVIALNTDVTADENTTIMAWLNWYAGL